MITELPLYNKILIVFIDFLGIWLGIVTYLYIQKKSLARIFLSSIGAMFLWVNFAYVARLIGQQRPNLGLISLKIAWFATPLLFVLLYFLVVFYLNKEKKYSILNKIIFFSGLVVSLITVFTNLIVKDIEFVGSDLTIIYGQGMFPFLGIVFLFMCAPLYILFKEYIMSKSEERIKVEYLLVGTLIFYIANIIFNITFPIFFEVVHLYWIGDYSSIILLGFVAYAIVRRELFGIKVILTTLLVSVIAILLALDIFIFTTELMSRIYKGIILIIFIYFGYLLIKSVLREIELREKIKKAYEIEKKAKEGLKKLDEAKNQFIMATQHHLRTPLTSMIGYLDLIFGGTYGKVSPRIKEALQKFQISTNRLIKVINEFLDISQFQLGKKVITLQPDVHIEPIFEEIVDELQLEAKARGIYLKLQKQAKMPGIKADPEKLKLALYNIVDNGIKYTNEGGVTIKLKVENSRLRIIVKDTGAGISKEDQKTLFTRLFERGKEAKKLHGTGRGIGLYIAFHIVKAHNGKIWVESEGRGKGSTFFIELPVG